MFDRLSICIRLRLSNRGNRLSCRNRLCLHLSNRLRLCCGLLSLNSGLLLGNLCSRLSCRLGSGRTAISAERLAFIYQRTA